MRRACGPFQGARFLRGFELIAREHQKLLGVAISVIGLLLVDFSFSKKPAGFVSKLDIFSRVLPDNFSQLAHFTSFHVLEIMVTDLATALCRSAAIKDRIRIAWRIPLAAIRVLELFLNCKSWAELARFIAPMPVRVNENRRLKLWLARITAG
jgi:hypothetical protein